MLWPRRSAHPLSRPIWRFLALSVGRDRELLHPLLLWALLLPVLLIPAGRLGSSLPPPRDPEEVSTLRAVRGQLLPNLRVFRSRSHHLA